MLVPFQSIAALLFFFVSGQSLIILMRSRFEVENLAHGLSLALGYVFTNLLFFIVFNITSNSLVSAIAVVFWFIGSLIFLLFFTPIVAISEGLKKSKYPIFIFVVITFFAFWQFLFSEPASFFLTANEDTFDGMIGAHAYLSSGIFSTGFNPLAFGVGEGRLFDPLQTKQVEDFLSVDYFDPDGGEALWRSRFYDYTGAIQYSALALVSLIIFQPTGLDAFFVNSMICFGLFGVSIFSFVERYASTNAYKSILISITAVLGNFYLTTFFNGHIGSMMYNAVFVFFVLSFMSILEKKKQYSHVLICFIILLFLYRCYPYPLVYSIPPLIALLALHHMGAILDKNGRMYHLLALRTKSDAIALLAVSLFFMTTIFFLSFELLEPVRNRAFENFRSWGTMETYVGILQFWGLWFSGLTYSPSPLSLVIQSPQLIIGSLLICGLVAITASVGFVEICKKHKFTPQGRQTLFVISLTAILFFLIMKFSSKDTYYLYKFLYIHQWILIILFYLGVFKLLKSNSMLTQLVAGTVLVLFLSANMANNVLAFNLIGSREINRNPERAMSFLSAPKHYLEDIFVAIPAYDRSDFVKTTLLQNGVNLNHDISQSATILIENSFKDINKIPDVQPLWNNGTYSIIKLPDTIFTTVSSYFAAEGAVRSKFDQTFGISYLDHAILSHQNAVPFRWVGARRANNLKISVFNVEEDKQYYLGFCAEPRFEKKPQIKLISDNGVKLKEFVLTKFQCFNLPANGSLFPLKIMQTDDVEPMSILDRRRLSFKVFKVDVSEKDQTETLRFFSPFPDIFKKGLNPEATGTRLSFYDGWHDPEKYNGQFFRWMKNEGKIDILSEHQRLAFEFDVDNPFWSEKEPTIVKFFAENGTVLEECKFEYSSTCKFVIDKSILGANQRINIKVAGPSSTNKNDHRTLALRLHEIRISKK